MGGVLSNCVSSLLLTLSVHSFIYIRMNSWISWILTSSTGLSQFLSLFTLMLKNCSRFGQCELRQLLCHSDRPPSFSEDQLALWHMTFQVHLILGPSALESATYPKSPLSEEWHREAKTQALGVLTTKSTPRPSQGQN